MARSSSPPEGAGQKNLDIQSRPSDKMNLHHSFYFEQSQEGEVPSGPKAGTKVQSGTPSLPEEVKPSMTNPSKFELNACDEDSNSEVTPKKAETPRKQHPRPITMLRQQPPPNQQSPTLGPRNKPPLAQMSPQQKS